MVAGYMGKILFVDLSNGKLSEELPQEKFYRDFLGGYGLGARIIYSRQRGGVNPLGPENNIGFVTGPLTGVRGLLGSRFTVVGKSPLTGGWGDANCGGYFGPYLKFSGYDAVFFNGVSAKPVYLLIDDGKAELWDASHLWGKDSWETEEVLQRELGKKIAVACIGLAGEKLSLISCVMHDKGTAAARSGLGAVMGSKKLKAVAVIGTKEVPVPDKNKVAQVYKEYLGLLSGDYYERFKKWGTCGDNANAASNGDSPVKNWTGVGSIDFPNAKAISDDAVIALQERKHACLWCPIACKGIMKAGKTYDYKAGVHKPEYETSAAFGMMLLNDNLESIIKANDICNRYGLDTISAGATIAFAIECYENGIITKRDTGGIELSWVKRRCGDIIDRFVACAGISTDDPSPARIASVNYFGMIDLLDGLFDSLKRGKAPAAVVISSNSAQLRVLDDDPYVLALLEHDEVKARRMIDEIGDTKLAYMGSKNAVARAIRRRAMVWGNAGVRLNAVAPGNTKTPQLQRGLDHPVFGDLIRALPRPLGRDAEPDEIAVVVAFLLSRDASYIHGAVYYVDGGIDAVARPDRF